MSTNTPNSFLNLSQNSSSTEPLPALRPGDSLFETAQAASQYIRAARASSTRRAYESDWHDFLAWCKEHQIEPLPAAPSSIALYLTSLAQRGRKVATIARRLTSINVAHKRVGLAPPTRNQQLITETMQGIRRTLGVRQKVKQPIDMELLKRSLASAEGALAASRDRAIFLVGFAGGMRRSELAAMKFEDLTWHKRGITLFLPHSKTDQEGQGREVELPLGSQDNNVPLAECTCPVRALEQWLKIANITSGPIFRRISYAQSVGKTGLDPRSIAEIVKRLLRRTGLSEKEVARYGAHSLRAGFATEAYSKGASELAIMRQTGHKSSAMVRRYIRSDKADRMAAASKLGL